MSYDRFGLFFQFLKRPTHPNSILPSRRVGSRRADLHSNLAGRLDGERSDRVQIQMYTRRRLMGRVSPVSSCSNRWSSKLLRWTFKNPEGILVEDLQCKNYRTSNTAYYSLQTSRFIHLHYWHQTLKNTLTGSTGSLSKWHQSVPTVRTCNEGHHSNRVPKTNSVRYLPFIRPKSIHSKFNISLGCELDHLYCGYNLRNR